MWSEGSLFLKVFFSPFFLYSRYVISHNHHIIIVKCCACFSKASSRRARFSASTARRMRCALRFFLSSRFFCLCRRFFSSFLSVSFLSFDESIPVKVVDTTRTRFDAIPSLFLSLSTTTTTKNNNNNNSSCGKFSAETPRIKCPRSSRFCFRRRSRPRFPWCCSSSEKCRRRSRRRF